MNKNNIRNIAIIAHVDHGKTTLVDELLKQSGLFRDNQQVQKRMMDSNDLERERGITILSKNTAIQYGEYKINIVDTPGHADFGGEVERILKMVDGVVLVVDAFEGPMPQTKFVLRNALELELPVIVCVNKIDRPDARISAVIDEVLELFMELNANDEQLNSPFIFASAKAGIASIKEDVQGTDMKPMFEAIIEHMPAPEGSIDAPLQMLITTIDYNEYLGRIGIGKIQNGTIHSNDNVVIVNAHKEDKFNKEKISKLLNFEGLERVQTDEATVGEIVAVAGIDDLQIGDTICGTENPVAINFNEVTAPTIAMTFMVNDSPFAGRDGKFITSRHVRDRLFRELLTDVSLRVEDTDRAEAFKVSGRGELHLSILIETMRREGYEFQVSKPEVLYKYENDKRMEPMESVIIDVKDDFVGTVIEAMGIRKGELVNMQPNNEGSTKLEFSIPSRGLIGYRTEFLTSTKGTGVINSLFDGYGEFKGEIDTRNLGSLIAFETGEATSYGLANAQERGDLFITPTTKVYAGMVVGRNIRSGDMEVNICKKKQLTNMRASGSDDNVKLTPPLSLSLEQAIEFIANDELLEITPLELRIRKRYLDPTTRKRNSKS